MKSDEYHVPGGSTGIGTGTWALDVETCALKKIHLLLVYRCEIINQNTLMQETLFSIE